MNRVKGNAMLQFMLAGASFGMGMYECRKEHIIDGLLGGVWFAIAGLNIFYIIEP